VSAADFRNIVVRNDASRPERLFRAAVSAFCSITRPTRREVAQLEDLTLPLLDFVSIDARRYVAAALSECRIAPAGLISRLADDRIDIAAPLLLRSPLLHDVELIALIGRHGISHARAIARRPGLNPTIAQLIRALEASADAQKSLSMRTRAAPVPQAEPAFELAPAAQLSQSVESGTAADEVRDRLREMMIPAAAQLRDPRTMLPDDRNVFAKLRDTALTGNNGFFTTALADALGMNLESVRPITTGSGYSLLLSALRSLELPEEQAFLIAAAVFPSQFPHPESIRIFLGRYRALDLDIARERVRSWKLEMVASWISRNAGGAGKAPLVAENSDSAERPALVRAS
jgi:uncharacterized protein (DUF2336 family)